MKKVLFAALALAVSMTGFAQRVAVNPAAKNATVTVQKPSALRQIDGSAAQGIQFAQPESMPQVVRQTNGLEEASTMTTNYDLQSNSALGNRVATWPDGTASFVATWDHSGATSFPDRGAGYNYYDGAAFGDEPEERQEPIKSGWPSIAACGDGEVMASHATGVNLYYRPTKGEGEWELIYNWGNDYGAPTWPRVVVSGPNNEYIHLVMCKQISVGDEYDNHIYYVRIKHDGDTWDIPEEMLDFPGVDNDADGEYRNQLSADDYVMAANGNNVACMFGAYTTEVFYMISHDNGETWERQIIAPYPIADEEGNCLHAVDFADYPEGMTDTINTGDNSHSIAIDNNGVVHASFGLFHWRVSDAEHYTYYPAGYFGIVYWNSNYTNEKGGHEILPFGESSIDAAHQAEWGSNHLGWTLHPDRISELAELDGQGANLRLFGYVDENGNEQLDYDNVTGATWHYRSLGLATMPAVSVDETGNVLIAYSVWSETRVCEETGFSYRSIYATLRDNGGTWYDDVINVNAGFTHQYGEAYPVTAAPNAYDGAFWVFYSEDDMQGLYLDISDTYPNSNGGALTENYQYAVKIIPTQDMIGLEAWGVEENEVVNPMTAVRVYPNPATDVLNIEVNASQSSEMNISVYNLMGQKVMEQNTSINVGINRPTINTAELNAGIYFVTVKANGFDQTMKFIVK